MPFYQPLSQGSCERPWFGVPFFHARGKNTMITEREAELISEYEQLRRNYDQLTKVVAWVENRLVTIEWLLPEQYVFTGDTAQPCRRG